jgi:hypothetical protein
VVVAQFPFFQIGLDDFLGVVPGPTPVGHVVVPPPARPRLCRDLSTSSNAMLAVADAPAARGGKEVVASSCLLAFWGLSIQLSGCILFW